MEDVMTRLSIGATVLAMALTSNFAFAENDHGSFKPKAYDSLGKCVQKALSKYDGDIVKLEYHVEDKKPTYEFDIETPDGKAWEVECNVKSGKITELEEEVAFDDPRFASQVKVDIEKARATALAAHPGRIVEVEYELESNGKASYEIDVLEADGEEVKVEIDVATGKIIEVAYENYQIGQE
jgi:uncharacterized membrane protein YkoI